MIKHINKIVMQRTLWFVKCTNCKYLPTAADQYPCNLCLKDFLKVTKKYFVKERHIVICSDTLI